MDISEFPLWLGRIAGAVQADAAVAAANAMAKEFHTELTDVTLRKYTHKPGNVTTSPPGEPPALVTGTLRRSAQIVPAIGTGPRAVSAVRMSVVYARIQELGGLAGRNHASRLPARPYLRPTRDLLLTTRRLQARASQAVAAVVREAAG